MCQSIHIVLHHPDSQVTVEPEDAPAFKARIQGLIDRYEAQFLPRRKRKLTTEQIREMDAGASAVVINIIDLN